MIVNAVAVDDDDEALKPGGLNSEWCSMDTGRASVAGWTDVDAYLSVRRDGSVWLRLGTAAAFDWALTDVRRPRVQTPVIVARACAPVLLSSSGLGLAETVSQLHLCSFINPLFSSPRSSASDSGCCSFAAKISSLC